MTTPLRTVCVHFPETPFDLVFPGEEPETVIGALRAHLEQRRVVVISDPELAASDAEPSEWTIINFGAISHVSVTVLDGDSTPLAPPGTYAMIQTFVEPDGQLRFYA